MTFYRITTAAHTSPRDAFSGLGAATVAHRWNHKVHSNRAVYASDSLALACLEKLVHLDSPRQFPPSVYFRLEIPDALLLRPHLNSLPRNWNAPVAGDATRQYGQNFLDRNQAVGLVVQTAILPEGLNVLINTAHPAFRLHWAAGPYDFAFDTRLT